MVPSESALKSDGRLRFSSSTRFHERLIVLACVIASRRRSMSNALPVVVSSTPINSRSWAAT